MPQTTSEPAIQGTRSIPGSGGEGGTEEVRSIVLRHAVRLTQLQEQRTERDGQERSWQAWSGPLVAEEV